MKIKNYQIVFLSLIFFVLITCQGCAPFVYRPAAQVVPVLEERGNLKIGAEVSVSNPLYNLFIGQQGSLRLRGSYGITDFLGLHLESSISLDTVDYRTHLGGGLGYYSHLEENTFFQIYALGRTGQVDYNGESDWNGAAFKASYTSLGIQPGVGYEIDKFTFGLFTNIKRVHYYGIESKRAIKENATLVEPAVGFSYLVGKFSIDAEFGLSFELADKTTNQGYLAFGVGYNLNTRKKRRKPVRGRGGI